MNLVKNTSSDGASSRINVRTIAKISELSIKPIKSIEIQSINIENLDQIKNLISSPGDTNVTLKINNNNTYHQYKLNEKRKIDQNTISQLKNAGVTLKFIKKELVLIQNNCKKSSKINSHTVFG